MKLILGILALIGICLGEFVSCNSAIKLKHVSSKFHLHSHSVNWGTGSGQQSVTCNKSQDDVNSLWVVKEAYGAEKKCVIGQPLKCGSEIRLEHVGTHKNLHSHNFKSPLSGQQEVSGFGDGDSSDSGDNWKIQCLVGAENWESKKKVRLQHVNTGKYLHSHQTHVFNQRNCPRCPIIGQAEVTAFGIGSDEGNIWAATQGIYFEESDEDY